jgi:hypothetical protein
LLLITLALFAIIIIQLAANQVVWASNTQPTMRITKAIGYSGLSLSSECLSSMNPILELTCLTDVPGGYCLHWSCGMVQPNAIEQPFHLEVIRR